MTNAVVLPRLAGSREAARRIVDSAERPIADHEVVFDCRQLRSAPPSFADEVVLATLVEGHASKLVLLDPSDEFERYVREAAVRRDVDSLVVSESAGSQAS